tara:strand:+ start:201 stop:422 length:222 start_codon:yes stop_codon:yes gene_type:complete
LINKKLGVRIIEFLLGIHVWIDIAEVIAAVYEAAYITAAIAVVGIFTFIAAAIFLENGHNHNKTLVDSYGNKN